jgi:hypothetical protein
VAKGGGVDGVGLADNLLLPKPGESFIATILLNRIINRFTLNKKARKVGFS